MTRCTIICPYREALFPVDAPKCEILTWVMLDKCLPRRSFRWVNFLTSRWLGAKRTRERERNGMLPLPYNFSNWTFYAKTGAARTLALDKKVGRLQFFTPSFFSRWFLSHLRELHDSFPNLASSVNVFIPPMYRIQEQTRAGRTPAIRVSQAEIWILSRHGYV